MDGRAAERDPETLVEVFRADIDRVERTYDLLAQLDAFNVGLAMANDEAHWRRQALELRSRLSVLL